MGIANEFNAMMNVSCWILSQDDLADPQVNNVMSVHLFNCAAEFDMRTKKTTQMYPEKMLLMAKAPADKVCEIRWGIADEILSYDLARLEINTLKIRLLYEAELKEAMATGKLPFDLFILIWRLTRK